VIQQDHMPAAGIDSIAAGIGSRLDRSPLALMLDVDGTLAPIAPTPADARVPDETRAVLRKLAQLRGVTIAFVSGRSAQDAGRLAGMDGAWIIGNHGIELRAPTGEITVDAQVAPFERAIADAASALRGIEQAEPGVILENKRWTLSLHYRLVSAGRRAGVVNRGRDIARQFGLRTRDAKMTLELRPPANVDKGTAVLALAKRMGVGGNSGAALYAGDDTTDEDAFRALRASVSSAVTVRITGPDDRVDGEEGGGGGNAQTTAEFILASPAQLRDLLDWISGRRARAAV
jgi:trehalose-phosphatase